MSVNITLYLREEYLRGADICLESKEYNSTWPREMKAYDPNAFPAGFRLYVHRVSGQPVEIYIEEFTTETEKVIHALHEHPLPWAFTLDSFGLKEKPLEDILLAILEKYKDLTLYWEQV